MSNRANINNIDKSVFVDLFSTATYGCEWLSVKTLKSERCLDEAYDKDYLDNRCREEKWADRLMNGGHIICVDYLDDDIDYNDSPAEYRLNLNDIKKGLKKARDGKAVKAWSNFVSGEDDYYDCNDLMQVIMFGEVVYG